MLFLSIWIYLFFTLSFIAKHILEKYLFQNNTFKFLFEIVISIVGGRFEVNLNNKVIKLCYKTDILVKLVVVRRQEIRLQRYWNNLQDLFRFNN